MRKDAGPDLRRRQQKCLTGESRAYQTYRFALPNSLNVFSRVQGNSISIEGAMCRKRIVTGVLEFIRVLAIPFCTTLARLRAYVSMKVLREGVQRDAKQALWY